MTAETLGPTLRSLLPRLWSFAFRLSGTAGLAEDLADRTFVRLVRRWDISVSEPITLVSALREMYTVWQCEFGGAYFRAHDHEASPGAARLASEGGLVDAIRSLSGLERAVVLLSYLERLSVHDIASITSEPIGRVLSAMSAAHLKASQRIIPEWRATRCAEGL
jgi:RNA polymerase sigma-70 factor (ECF subfamily)